MTLDEDYRALRGGAALGALAPRAPISLAGRDRASFLQGLLTNDVAALAPGTGCYAAWLTPQGRMLMDLHVFNAGDRIIIDVPAQLIEPTLKRLDQSLFSEDVQFEDLSSALAPAWIHGPSAAEVVEQATGATGLASWAEYQNARIDFEGSPVLLARVSQLGVPGFCAYVEPPRAAAIVAAFHSAGALTASREAIEAARVETGYPVFGVDMTGDTIPLEAGIESRALSFTKGCYVGQEVIVRVLHRGHGRVARKLVGLRVEKDGAFPSARILGAGRDVGWVTSAARSPRAGAVAMGYVHRDFVLAGTHVEIETPSAPIAAVVSECPIRPVA